MFRMLMPLLMSLLMTLLTLSSIACTYSDKKPDYSELTLCPEQRPQICTREYNPVCATLKDGGEKTGSTGCTACSDPRVIGYKVGKC